MKNNFDYIIVGSGAAGLTTALTLRNAGNVAIFTKKNPSDSSTNLAQGGMAAMIGEGDQADWHIEDTMKAGDFHNKKEAVKLLVKNSQEAFKEGNKKGKGMDENHAKMVSQKTGASCNIYFRGYTLARQDYRNILRRSKI